MHQAPSLVTHYAQDTVMLEVNSLKSHQVQKPNEFKNPLLIVMLKLKSWNGILLILLRFNLPDLMKFKI